MQKVNAILLVVPPTDQISMLSDGFVGMFSAPITIHRVKNNEEALPYLSHNTVDCILYAITDSSSGSPVDLLAQLRALPVVQPPLILLAHQKEAKTCANYLKQGIYDYLIREDLLPEKLHKSIVNAVENSRLMGKLAECEASKNYLTHYDPVTGLPNRLGFEEYVNPAISRAKRNERHIAILIISLLDYKSLINSYSEENVNELFHEVGKRLNSVLRAEDMLARFAKSKFILLLDEMSRLEEAATVANRIVRNFNAPFTLGSDELVLNLNVGIACYPISGESTLELVRNASASLAFLDKASEKNAFHYYNEVIDARADERLKFEEHLEEAFKNESLYLDYQPIIDLDTQMLYGVEALLRWRSEEYGEVSPERIIPIAEESGLIVDLGYWIIERVFQQYIEWQNTMRPFRVSINITPRQLYDVTWRDTILALIKKYQIDPNFIIFELTERDIFSDLDRTNEQLRELAMLGCHLFIDDYGTGFSSINLIRRLPISGLKIDKSFVQGVDHDPEDAGLVKSILDLADNLNLVVIAEGVEKESQLEFIQSSSRGKKAQGFFFDRPMTPEAIQKRYSRAK